MHEVGVHTDSTVLYWAVRYELCIPTVFHICHFSSCTGSRREEWGTIIALIIGWPANIPAEETWRWDGDVGGHQVSWHVRYIFRRHHFCVGLCVRVPAHTYYFVNTSHPQKLPEAEIRAGEELQPGASVVHQSSLPVGLLILPLHEMSSTVCCDSTPGSAEAVSNACTEKKAHHTSCRQWLWQGPTQVRQSPLIGEG